MQKLVLNPSYSRFFDSNGNSTPHPPGFFGKVLELSILIVFFTFSKESFILCLARLPKNVVESSKKQTKCITESNREHHENYTTKVAFAKMKNVLTTLMTMCFAAILFSGCSKPDGEIMTPRDQNVKFLTGDGNRVWRLKNIYVNNLQVVMTDAQMRYTKTYTINPAQAYTGSFVNSDGYTGKWRMITDLQLNEVFSNNPAGGVAIDYYINEISATLLDIEYTSNLKTVREVYHAY